VPPAEHSLTCWLGCIVCHCPGCAQGRLDYATEGLLLLTNNGDLAHYLEHPASEFERKYKAKIHGFVRGRPRIERSRS